ncbi:BQ5605_C002g01187 [Microbotryum silenes-dioicae]|uniref:BQ5605_C002g01187 protein n=1 Tax=Microbotryum silenes-dioicae TaxID=796604 RepID=A0A2X0MSV1_9BASI|nr:BQ5605_C002g01187 [Microbotryum silenes-dioicae]
MVKNAEKTILIRFGIQEDCFQTLYHESGCSLVDMRNEAGTWIVSEKTRLCDMRRSKGVCKFPNESRLPAPRLVPVDSSSSGSESIMGKLVSVAGECDAVRSVESPSEKTNRLRMPFNLLAESERGIVGLENVGNPIGFVVVVGDTRAPSESTDRTCGRSFVRFEPGRGRTKEVCG